MKKLNKPHFPSWEKLLATAFTSLIIISGTAVLKNLPYIIGEQVLEVVDGDTFSSKLIIRQSDSTV
jgi:hypothetical protein